jgi:hypothetical protein
MPTCLICLKWFPSRVVVDGVERTVNRRKYCLECSPFGLHNTKQLHPNARRKNTNGHPVSMCQNCGDPLKHPSGRFCTKKCQASWQYKEYILKWKAGEISGTSGDDWMSVHIRRYLLELRGQACWQCGWAVMNPTTNKVPLTIDHIDGDASNNTEDNLRVLCPNCHSLTPTYGGANLGNGRPARRLVFARRRAQLIALGAPQRLRKHKPHKTQSLF